MSVIAESLQNPFKHLEKAIDIDGETFYYYDISKFEQVSKLPYSIRILLENALRNCDGNFHIKESDVLTILNWATYNEEGAESNKEYEIPFKPARVILQDANGVPAGKEIKFLSKIKTFSSFFFFKLWTLLQCVTLF